MKLSSITDDNDGLMIRVTESGRGRIEMMEKEIRNRESNHKILIRESPGIRTYFHYATGKVIHSVF